MKRILSTVFLVFFMLLATNAIAATSNYTYTLDIDIPDPGMITDIQEMIGNVSFEVYGGTFNDDWTIILGSAVPSTEGLWVFENFGDWNAVYDDYNWSDPEYAPIESGNIITILSDVELSFDSLNFYDFRGQSVDAAYFSTEGFTQTAVPVPGTLVLLGSGLLGFFGVTRRKE